MDYSIIKPQRGYVVIKEEEEKSSGLITSGMSEDRAYARIVSVNEDSDFKVGSLIVYNEYEGQELYKFGPIKEEGIIIIREENILAVIKE